MVTQEQDLLGGVEALEKRHLVQAAQVHHNLNLLGNISILYRDSMIMTSNIISNENMQELGNYMMS